MLDDFIKIRVLIFFITIVTGSLLNLEVSLAAPPQVSAGFDQTVGLKADGTVIAVGYNGSGQTDVGSWTNIQQVAAGGNHTVGLKADGTVVAVGLNSLGQSNVDDWELKKVMNLQSIYFLLLGE